MSEPIDSWLHKKLYFLKYSSLESTNNVALELMRKKSIGGPSVIIALHQNNGRGQVRTKWHSNPNENLLFSLVLPQLNLPIENQYLLNKAVSISLLQSLLPFTGDVKVKWPNDIYYKSKKLAGILIENQVQNSNLKSTVIGIGLNINQTTFPPELPNAISLKNITNKNIDLESDESTFVYQFYQNLIGFLNSEETIEALYQSNLFGLGETKFFKDKNGKFKGAIKGVSKNGQLIIETNNTDHLYNFKEVEFLL